MSESPPPYSAPALLVPPAPIHALPPLLLPILFLLLLLLPILPPPVLSPSPAPTHTPFPLAPTHTPPPPSSSPTTAAPPAPLLITLLSPPRTLHPHAALRRTTEVTSEGPISMAKFCYATSELELLETPQGTRISQVRVKGVSH